MKGFEAPKPKTNESITTNSIDQETMLMRGDREWATAEQLIACVDNYPFMVARRMFTATDSDRRDDLGAARNDVCLALLPKMAGIIERAETEDWSDFNSKSHMMQIVGAAMATGKADAAQAMDAINKINASKLK